MEQLKNHVTWATLAAVMVTFTLFALIRLDQSFGQSTAEMVVLTGFLFVAAFLVILMFIRGIWQLFTFPHLGWRRILLVGSCVGAGISTLLVLTRSQGRLGLEDAFQVVVFLLIGFSFSPFIIGEGFALWKWICAGFGQLPEASNPRDAKRESTL